MLLTEYSSSSAPLATTASIALKEASTGPLPCASERRSTPFSDTTIFAYGSSPVSEWAVSETSL